MDEQAMPHRVVFYTKPGCHLCDLVRDDLALLGFEMDLVVETVDIAADPVLLERYQALIPVVDVDGGPLLMPPITLGRLREVLADAHCSSLALDGASDSKAAAP